MRTLRLKGKRGAGVIGVNTNSPLKTPVKYRFPASRPIFDMERFGKALRPDGTAIDPKRGGVQWDRCIYYYWWRFLRLSDNYRAICQDGKRPRTSLHAKVHEDFGNVFEFEDTAQGFEAWWTERLEPFETYRGAYLFGFQVQARVQLVTDINAFDPEHSFLVSIPKTRRIREIKSQFEKLLKRELQRKRGQRLKDSDVRYRPLHERMTGLDSALAVYELRRQHPEMPLWEIAHLANVSAKVSLDGDEASRGKHAHSADKKAYLSSHGHRLYTRAKKVIAGVDHGVFPRTL